MVPAPRGAFPPVDLAGACDGTLVPWFGVPRPFGAIRSGGGSNGGNGGAGRGVAPWGGAARYWTGLRLFRALRHPTVRRFQASGRGALVVFFLLRTRGVTAHWLPTCRHLSPPPVHPTARRPAWRAAGRRAGSAPTRGPPLAGWGPPAGWGPAPAPPAASPPPPPLRARRARARLAARACGTACRTTRSQTGAASRAPTAGAPWRGRGCQTPARTPATGIGAGAPCGAPSPCGV